LSPEYPAIGTARALAEANTVAPIAAVTAQKALTDPLSRIALSPISHKVDFTTVILLLESPLPNDYYSSPRTHFTCINPKKGVASRTRVNPRASLTWKQPWNAITSRRMRLQHSSLEQAGSAGIASLAASTILGSRIVKVEPRPGSLSTVMSPPII
jgi:hypothetical protein